MPLKKLVLKAGVNKENTRYTNENGWYVSDKVRFRQGTPEKIGGWERISANTFLGVCRFLWNWVTLGFENLVSVGTNLKFYIESDGVYNDITPIRSTVTLPNNPFTGNDTTIVTVTTSANHGAGIGDYVTFSGATGTYNSTFNAQFQIVNIPSTTTFTIDVGTIIATGSYGGASVSAAFQINVGPAIVEPYFGWGAGPWGYGSWGNELSSTTSIRLWSANNWGEDLVFGPRGGGLYYWDATNGVSTRGVNVNTLGGAVTLTIASPCVITLSNVLAEGTAIQLATTGALPTGLTAGTTYYLRDVDGVTANLSATATGALINTSGTQSGTHSISLLVDVPTKQNYIVVSDTSRFVLLFGTTDYGSSVLNPMLIRWSNQESVVDWYPGELSQSRTLTLSHGSEIITALQTRQEIVVFTDSSIYSLQYVGAPVVWSSQLLADNISIVSQNAVATASGVIYWMGVDKFYLYSGRVQTLRCDLRRHIFGDINTQQFIQVYAGTNEGFNEVWWFYPSADSNQNNRYVVYNYVEDIWHYGTISRTAWIDSGLRDYPVAATYNYNLVNHEKGLDDNETGTPAAINAYIESAEFDIEDGEHFGFVWRMVPDLTFQGSTANTPQVVMTLYGMNGSGSGINTDASKAVARTSTATIEQFTNIIYTRIRGRQMIMKIESNQLGIAWQLGSPRIDLRPDGRR